MTCWIEFHATKLVRLQKFHGLKKDLSLSKLETLGLLSLFWGEVIELRESGDISVWSPEYLCELLGSKLVPERVWEALELNGWIDRVSDGRILVHDWLDFAGKYLRGKYKTKNKSKLIEIWAVHGRKYGEPEEEAERLPQGSKEEVKKPPSGSKKEVKRRPTIPNHTIPYQNNTPSPPLSGGEGDWRESFEIYQNELDKFFTDIKQDFPWIRNQERFNPGIDILLSVEKAIENYWGTEGAWRQKKKSKTEVIDWKSTMANAITMQNNKVFKQYQKNSPTPPSQNHSDEFIPPTLDELERELKESNL